LLDPTEYTLVLHHQAAPIATSVKKETIILQNVNQKLTAFFMKDERISGCADLNLTESELKLLTFPKKQEEKVILKYTDYSGLIEKLAVNCSLKEGFDSNKVKKDKKFYANQWADKLNDYFCFYFKEDESKLNSVSRILEQIRKYAKSGKNVNDQEVTDQLNYLQGLMQLGRKQENNNNTVVSKIN
jgi:hypothetical protein